MGEEGETIEFYSGKETVVLWNIDDYPVPDGTDLVPIRSNIEEALYQMGFDGYADVSVHCEQLKYDDEKLFQTGRVFYLPESTQGDAVDMTYYLLIISDNCGAGHHVNVVVISKKPNSELLRVLRCLKSRGHNALLVEPPYDEGGLFSVESLVENARLLSGEKPRLKKELTPDDLREDDSESDPRNSYNNEEEEEEDLSHLSNKMADFSERTKHDKGDRTVIFWDAEDCPFPLCFSSPDQIYGKIKLDLLKRGFSGKISIWAYVDESKKDSEWNKYLSDKTWVSRIYFLPGGNSASRRIRMLNDMLLLTRDSRPSRYYEVSLILVSDQFIGDGSYLEKFKKLEYRKYHLVLVIPSEYINKSESPDEWPRLLMDEAYHLRDDA